MTEHMDDTPESYPPWTRAGSRGISSLEGCYLDTKHGPCLRRIHKIRTNEYVIRGVYGNNEKKPEGQLWFAKVTTEAEVGGKISMQVDFTGKDLKSGDPKVKRAKFVLTSKTIQWDDKNVWTPVYSDPKLFQDVPGTGFNGSLCGNVRSK